MVDWTAAVLAEGNALETGMEVHLCPSVVIQRSASPRSCLSTFLDHRMTLFQQALHRARQKPASFIHACQKTSRSHTQSNEGDR